MRERFAKGLAKFLEGVPGVKMASRLLSFKAMKHDLEATQAAIEAVKAARAATDAATEAVNAAAAALNAAAGVNGESSPIIVGAPQWNAGQPGAPECPSHKGKTGWKFRGIKGRISSRQ